MAALSVDGAVGDRRRAVGVADDTAAAVDGRVALDRAAGDRQGGVIVDTAAAARAGAVLPSIVLPSVTVTVPVGCSDAAALAGGRVVLDRAAAVTVRMPSLETSMPPPPYNRGSCELPVDRAVADRQRAVIRDVDAAAGAGHSPPRWSSPRGSSPRRARPGKPQRRCRR